MKRIFIVVSLCMLTSFSFAQKKAVKDAKSALSKEQFNEAKDLIKPALTDPETATDPETWKTAGDIDFKAADKEIDKEKLKEFQKEGANEEVMYSSMYNLFKPYIVADSLGQLPDAKGKTKNKVRKDIVKNLKTVFPYYANAGVYYNQKNNFAKASEMFEMYWNIPSLNLFSAEDVKELKANIIDSTYQVIKYYSVITSIQAKDSKRSLYLLNKIVSEPYVANGSYKESDPYELIANEYLSNGDTVKYVQSLKTGAEKFPSNQYFTLNLINEYLKTGNDKNALDFLEQAIANSPNDKCLFVSVKASLYTDKKEYDTALKIYSDALDADPSCERALEGLALVYALQAQEFKETISQLSRKEQVEADKKTTELYLKALPLFEKLYNIQVEKSDSKPNIKKTLLKLQNVYYNLSLLKVDKAKELESVEAQLEELKYD